MVTVVHELKLSAVLAEFARTLTTDFPIQRILDHLVERIVEVLPVTAAGVTLIAPGKAPRYIAASNAAALQFEQLQVELGQGPCVVAYETGEPVTIADLRTDDRFPAFAKAGVEADLVAVFALPLRHGEEQLGALDLYRDTPGPLDAGDMAAAQTLADVTAAYLLNAQSREDARAASDLYRDRSQHDHLTGLPNRLLLQQHLDHAIARSQRNPMNVAVLFVDLDDFKAVNDTYGHLVGDEMLVEASRRLSELVRTGDTLSRFSGDEFVFLCEDVHSEEDARAGPTHRHGIRRALRARGRKHSDDRQRRSGLRGIGRGRHRRSGLQCGHGDVPGQAPGPRRTPALRLAGRGPCG